MANTLTAIPVKIVAGTTVKYTRTESDYPAPTWTLTLYLSGASATSFIAAANGTDHDVTITSTLSAAILPGNYKWEERVTDGTDVYAVASGIVYFEANMASATAGSGQTYEEKTLAIIDGILSGRITKDQESYQIAGRAVSRIPFAELKRMRAELSAAVYMQRNPGRFGRPVRISFPPTGGEVT